MTKISFRYSHQLGKVKIGPLLALILLMLLILSLLFFWQRWNANKSPVIQTVSREGIVNKIQKLNRLETISYNVDAVITSRQAGSWQKLWQDQQKAIFIARGKVVAGVDLSQLGAQMVHVSEPTPEQMAKAMALQQQSDKEPKSIFKFGQNPQPVTVMSNIMVTLPPTQILSVYLDDIEIYDWQSGWMGMLKAEPALLKEAQISAKKEVLQRACANGILNQAEQQAQKQVKQLFEFTGATVSVTTQGTGSCQVMP